MPPGPGVANLLEIREKYEDTRPRAIFFLCEARIVSHGIGGTAYESDEWSGVRRSRARLGGETVEHGPMAAA
jgi:hypothetical protein